MNALSLWSRRPRSTEWAALAVGSAIATSIVVAVVGPIAGVALLIALFTLAGVIAAPGIVLAAYLLVEFYKGALQANSPIDITIFLALANAVQLAPLLFDSRPRAVSRVGIALWLSLGLLVLGGVLYAPDQSLALGNAVTYWALVILPILPAAIRVGTEPKYVRQFLWTFWAMAITIVALGLTQLSGTDRLVVLGENTIEMSRGALLIPLLGIAYVLPERRRLASTVTVVLIPAALVVAIASGSRGPLLVLVLMGVASAIGYLARLHAVRWRLVGGVAGLALASVFVISIAAPSLPAQSLGRFSSLGDFIGSGLSGDPSAAGGETSATARVRLFQFAIEMFGERPLIGAGTGGFAALSPSALGPDAAAYPHDAVLQVAAEYGMVGLALFLGVIALGLARPLPKGHTSVAIRALFVFFLLNAAISGDIFSDRETLGVLLVILSIEAPGLVAASVSSPVGERPAPSAARLADAT